MLSWYRWFMRIVETATFLFLLGVFLDWVMYVSIWATVSSLYWRNSRTVPIKWSQTWIFRYLSILIWIRFYWRFILSIVEYNFHGHWRFLRDFFSFFIWSFRALFYTWVLFYCHLWYLLNIWFIILWKVKIYVLFTIFCLKFFSNS